MGTVAMALSAQYRNLHIMARYPSMDNLYLERKTPLLARDMQVNFENNSARNNQAQCVLGYGWDIATYMAVHWQSVYTLMYRT